jgi:1D-myo-inositol 3-kinase
MQGAVQLAYTTVGHVTRDVLEDGSQRVGGSAFYAALQAARLGLRASIITRGVPREVERLLEPYRDELELVVLASDRSTVLETSGTGTARRQRIVSWAGAIDDLPHIDSSILHIAPVARETPGAWAGHADFVGLTPQGLVRAWAHEGAEVQLCDARAAAVAPPRWDALVISERERDGCAALLSQTASAHAIAVITAAGEATELLEPHAAPQRIDVVPQAHVADDLGAGDVWAAAFFVALSERRTARDAVLFAHAAAALRLQGRGPRAIADRAAIEAQLAAGTHEAIS